MGLIRIYRYECDGVGCDLAIQFDKTQIDPAGPRDWKTIDIYGRNWWFCPRCAAKLQQQFFGLVG